MDNIDLHTLRVFREVHRSGNLSRAAERLQLSQPAISQSLGKLRQHFDDALFVRVGNVMKPTPQAEQLLAAVLAAIDSLEATLACRVHFDAASTDRTFRLAMTDIGQIVLLPRLLDEVKRLAPRARLEIATLSELTPRQLEGGELDLAVGFVPQMPAGFYQQALFEERFACLARSDHPRVREAPTLAQFTEEAHVVVSTSGTGHLIVDRVLERLKLERRVAVVIPHFLGLETIVGATDHLSTLPRRAALLMAHRGAVRAWDMPFALPDYTVKQHWHEAQMRDPGHRWLREVMSSLFRP